MTGAVIVDAVVIGGLLIFMLILTLKNFHPEVTMIEKVLNDNNDKKLLNKDK